MIPIYINGMVKSLFSKQKKTVFNYCFSLVGIFGPPDTLYEGGYLKLIWNSQQLIHLQPPKVGQFQLLNI